MAGVEAVIFDWGGTLSVFADVDLLDLWRGCAERLAPERADDLCLHLLEVEQRAWDRVAIDQRSSRLADLLTQATSELGLDVTDAALEVAATSYLDAWTPHIVHEADAVPTLSWLREQGWRTGLLSNTHWPRQFHEHFLERDGLASLLDVRCYTSELAHTKPHREAFGAVLGALDVEASAAVFVGDRPFDDIHGAKAAGMRAVLKPNGFVPHHEVTPDGVIGALSELPNLLQAWASG